MSVAVGSNPVALAVNTVTNKIYVANRSSGNVTVIDGNNNTTTTVAAGNRPLDIAVNTVTNKIYVANNLSNDVTVIDGGTNQTTTLAAGTAPVAVAINSATNKIYVANHLSGNVTVIDGSNNTTTNIATGNQPSAIEVNLANNKMYVGHTLDNLTVIDGGNLTTTTISASVLANAIAVHPLTNQIFAALNNGQVTVITPVQTEPIPMTVAIAPLSNNLTNSPAPTFNFSGTSDANPVTRIYYQLDSLTGAWLPASPASAVASGQTPPLQLGTHTLYAFAADGQEASSANPSPNSSPLVGQIRAYPFIASPPSVMITSFPNPSLVGQSVTLVASVSTSDGSPVTGTVQFKDGGSNLGAPVAVINGTAILPTDNLTIGAHTITADYSGSATVFNATSSNPVIQNVTNTVTWTGATSSDWKAAGNWSSNFAPTSLTNVTIPASGVTNEPIISAANNTVNDLTVAAGHTVTINGGKTLTVNGTATISGTIAGMGTYLMSGSSLIDNGQISIASILFGAGSQSVSGSGAFTGNNTFIVLPGSTVTLANNFSLVNVYISSGGSLNMSGLIVSLAGAGAALQADGMLMTADSTIIYNGSAMQSTAPQNVTYHNLTIANSAGVNLSANTTVDGDLALTSGNLNTGAFTVTMPAAATSSGTGDVVGSVKRTGFTLASALSFGNPFNTIRFDSGTPPTEVTVNLDKNVPTTPSPFPQAIARKYTITPVGGSGYSATLRLHYQDTDLNGNSEGMSLNLWRYNGTSWQSQGQSAFDSSANWVEKSGVTQFSPWTMNSTSPTAVSVESVQATSYDGGTLIEWQTGYEVSNLGFNLYREEGGKRTTINAQLIAGSALLGGADTVLRSGRSYSFFDAEALLSKSKAYYWLEDVDLNGSSSWHGPFTVKVVGGSASSLNASPLIGQHTAAQAGATRPVERTAAVASKTTSQFSLQSSLAGLSAVKLWVKREGWYRVSAAELVQGGLNPAVNSGALQLYADGRQVPMHVVTDKQGQRAAIEFYGQGIDTPSSDARVYWLISGNEAGLRIPVLKADGIVTAASSFLQTVERRDRTIYFAALRNGERENFFGAVITSQPVDQTLTLQHLDESVSRTATLEVALQGVTTQAHRVWVYVNGQFTSELLFNGQAESVKSFDLRQAELRSGDDLVKLVSLDGPGDVSLVNYVRLSYWRRFTADDNALRFTASGQQAVTIDGFTSGSIRVFDVTDSDRIRELSGTIEQQKTEYAVTVTSPEVGERRLLAIADSQAMKPARIAANRTSSLQSPANGADLIVISRPDLSMSLQPLIALRRNQGLKVSLVDVEDIYDEFNYGVKSPQSIKAFLSYASTSWKIKPRYVLLAGEASYDTKNYLGFGDLDIVPTKLIDTQLMEAASDDWLADFDGDGIADLGIGRLPVRDAEAASAMVKKILSYEQGESAESVLLVADGNDGYDFEAASSGLRALLPATLRVAQINRGHLDANEARRQLLEAIALGQKVINYTGHGSANTWRGSLLTNEDARELTNHERLPMFVMMTCLNGYFDDPAFDSLGEALLKADNGGAVAVWASSGMTLPDGQSLMNQQLYRLLFGVGGQAPRIGDATAKAKSSIGDADVRRTWILLGDPTMRLK